MGSPRTSSDRRSADSASASASAPEPPSSGSSSPSFLSRFALPLRTHPRHIVDFYINADEPHRKYVAGDQVHGAVVLTVVKPVWITHLVVSLYGYMRLFKGPSVLANEPVIDPADVPSTLCHSSRPKGSGSPCVRLFQDEQTLSGDGKLKPGRYEFNFNLLFPQEGLPSNIDFERGTISYKIVATLTCPSSRKSRIPSKRSCERKVHFIEKIDVGSLSPPRPQTVSVDAFATRSRRKKSPIPAGKRSVAVEKSAPQALDPDSALVVENLPEGPPSVAGEDPEHDRAVNARSPVQSDTQSIGGESAVSGSSGRNRHGDGTLALAGKTASSVKDPCITATIELLKRGFLPGDLVPIKVSVQHIKFIKTMHGVIVTLYRQARIDSSPPSRSGQPHEVPYPKPRVGLSGLYLSPTGSCSVFRKDLCQTFTPLILDPETLTANFTTSVRVPIEAFPTIKGAPYGMISFEYFVEVIVNLGGKLSLQIQTGKSSGSRLAPMVGQAGITGSAYDQTSITPMTQPMVDTTQFLREKGVVGAVFHVVVGTADSSRPRGKDPTRPDPFASPTTVPVWEAGPYGGARSGKQPWTRTPGDGDGFSHDGYTQGHRAHSPNLRPLGGPQPHHYWDSAPLQPPPPSAPLYIPPPEIPDETALTEKERIRRAEQRLLPSQPPEAPVAGPSRAYVPTVENIYDADDQMTEDPAAPPPDSERPRADFRAPDAPSAPALEDLSPGGGTHATEDKQELERRRLLAEASAPPAFPDDYDSGAGGSSGTAASPLAPRAPGPGPGPSAPLEADLEPSAPVLEDEDAYGPQYAYGTAVAGPSTAQTLSSSGAPGPVEPLPRYER